MSGQSSLPKILQGRSAWFWVFGSIFAIFLVSGIASGGIGGAIVFLALLVLVTGLYTLISRRRSWLRLGGRKAGAIAVAGGMVMLIAGGLLLPSVEDARRTTASGDTSASSDEPSPTKSPAPEPEKKQDRPDSAGTALAQLATIDIKGRAPKPGYERDLFGSAWTDVNGNFCDTRNDILKRDLTNLVFNDNCEMATGTLADPFTATIIDFVRGMGTSSDVQVDHLLSVARTSIADNPTHQIVSGMSITVPNIVECFEDFFCL